MKINVLFFICIAAVSLATCAPSIGALQRHVESGRYDAAVEETAGDSEMERELAAIVLERAASRGVRTSELIGALAAAGKTGRRALGRLEKGAGGDAAKLAEIALTGHEEPEKEALSVFLGHDSSDVRAAAATAWFDELDAGLLKRLLLDIDPRVRRAAVKGLVRFEGAGGTDASLKDVLRLDPDPVVRSEAARNGKSLGSDALFSLKRALDDRSLGVRLAAVQGLATAGDPTALEIVEQLAGGEIDETAVAAASEFARLGRELGRKRIRDALADERPGIRATALLRLERAGLDDRDDILRDALEDEAPRVALLAAGMLMTSAQLDGPVAKALRRIEEQSGSDSAEARDMLAAIGDDKAVAELAALFKEGDEIEVTVSLGRACRSIELRSSFVRLMGDKRESVRIAAAMAVLKSEPKI